MPRPREIQNIIEEAVAEVLETAMPRLRADIVRRATEELQLLEPATGASPTDLLNAAAASIQEAASQAEILRHLLEGEARFARRVALFVVKGTAVHGWQGTGFEENDAVKSASLNTSASLVSRAIQGKSVATGSVSEFDTAFIATVRAPADGRCAVLPLVVKDRVAAIIYADAGAAPDGILDASALAALTRFAAVWLELTALRKAGPGIAEEAPAAVAAAAAPAGSPPQIVSEEGELHKKALRFAKLLVEEIKLYNQPKVAEGKQHKDLYERLREDIEKSRATYHKRYGETPVASSDYFNQELIRILADNDISLMGSSFPK